MPTKKNSKSTKPKLFHKRFNIDIDLEEAQRRFINRVKNQIFNTFFVLHDEPIFISDWFVYQNGNDLNILLIAE